MIPLSNANPTNSIMNTNHLKSAALALLPTLMLTLSSCTTVPGEHHAAVHKSDTAAISVETYKATATVTAIDAATRKVKLTLTNGKRIAVTCGPDVVNFGQSRINDRVKVTVTKEVAVYLDKAKPARATRDTMVGYAPIGAKPGKVVAHTVQATVKVAAIDIKTRNVTLVGEDGTSKTIKADERINLTKVKVGDSVTASVTEGMAVSVEKP